MDLQMLKLYKSWSFIIISYNIAIKKRRYNKNKNGYSEGSDAAGDISKDGKWFRDSHGRYLLFRGVNFASRSKLPPYLPIAPIDIKNLNQLDLEKEIESVKPQ